MGTTYRAVMLTRKGGPEALQAVELPVQAPGPGQLRVRVRATGVGATDLVMLGGHYPFAPKIPFVPGYETVGVVDAIGASVTGFDVGQRVAALTVWGGFGELLLREAEHFVPVHAEVSDHDAAAVILNFVTAWQMIHRVANVQAGQTALVTGAAGGVGIAALQVLRLAGVKTYGAASRKKRAIVRSLGATPIDYREGSMDSLVRVFEPDGVDYVFDAVGGANIGPCIGALRKGGMIVGFGLWGRPESSPKSLCSAIFFLARVCVAAAVASTESRPCTARIQGRFARICPRSSRFWRKRRSTRSLPIPLRFLKQGKLSNCWQRALWKARSF